MSRLLHRPRRFRCAKPPCDRMAGNRRPTTMTRKVVTVAIPALILAGAIAFAQTATKQDEVEIEMMTYPEIYSAIHERGKTTVLIYNGGTEQRGPHAIL